MNRIKLAIIDDNQEFCQLLADFFSGFPELELIEIAHNGSTGIKSIFAKKIDVLLLDMIMPKLDGLGVLQWLKDNQLENRPKVIVFSALGQDEVTKKAIKLGADYYIIKPFDLHTLVDRIRHISAENQPKPIVNQKPKPNLEMVVTEIIQSMNIPSHFKGFLYLRNAILMAIEEPELINNVTTKLYPMIAERYKTTKHRVERSMRFAIETAWNKGNLELLHSLFGYCVDDSKGKPTNASFIAKISDKLRLENKYKVV